MKADSWRRGKHLLLALMLAQVTLSVAPAWGSEKSVPPAPVFPTDPLIGVTYSLLPGYGMGHFLLRDYERGVNFLALDLGATALWLLGPSLAAIAQGEMPDKATAAGGWFFVLGMLAYGALRVWEVNSALKIAKAQQSAVAQPVDASINRALQRVEQFH